MYLYTVLRVFPVWNLFRVFQGRRLVHDKLSLSWNSSISTPKQSDNSHTLSWFHTATSHGSPHAPYSPAYLSARDFHPFSTTLRLRIWNPVWGLPEFSTSILCRCCGEVLWVPAFVPPLIVVLHCVPWVSSLHSFCSVEGSCNFPLWNCWGSWFP